MISTYDIIIFGIIIILVVIIIVISIKNTLNDRLSHVEVKIPEIEIPQPNIVVKVQRKCDSEQFDVVIDKTNIISPKQVVGLSPLSHKVSSEIPAESSIEKFEQVAQVTQQETPDNYICMTRAQFEKLSPATNKLKRYNDSVINQIKLTDLADCKNPNKCFNDRMEIMNASLDDKNDQTKGGNIGEYDDFASLDEIGRINLRNMDYKYPKPDRTVFHE